MPEISAEAESLCDSRSQYAKRSCFVQQSEPSPPEQTVNFFNPNFLFASMFWSSVSVGYWIYGKRQQAIVPMVGGILMFVASCFIPNVLLMSVACVGLMVLVYLLAKQGY